MPERKEADFLHEITFNEPSNCPDGITQMRAVKAESIGSFCRDAGKYASDYFSQFAHEGGRGTRESRHILSRGTRWIPFRCKVGAEGKRRMSSGLATHAFRFLLVWGCALRGGGGFSTVLSLSLRTLSQRHGLSTRSQPVCVRGHTQMGHWERPGHVLHVAIHATQ